MRHSHRILGFRAYNFLFTKIKFEEAFDNFFDTKDYKQLNKTLV